MPVYGNKRNGCWYGPFEKHCYFKSTDGHDRNLNFNSSTRLNLELALDASAHGGVLIVDSTKRGKTFPDSMRATIPLWCAVINTLLSLSPPDQFSAPDWLMPASLVSSIRSTVISRIVDSLSTDVKSFIREQLKDVTRPLRPVWIHPDEDGVLDWKGENAEEVLEHIAASNDENALDYTPVLLLSCSGSKKARHVSEQSWEYIQGAADDEEHWACGLSWDLFWANHDAILCSDDHAVVSNAVEALVNERDHASAGAVGLRCTAINETGLHVGSMGCVGSYGGSHGGSHGGWDCVIKVLSPIDETHAHTCLSSDLPGFTFYASCAKYDKTPWVSEIFPRVMEIYQNVGSSKSPASGPPRILIACQKEREGEGMTIALALMLAFHRCDARSSTFDGAFAATASKNDIRLMVTRLQSSIPDSPWHPHKHILKQVQIYFE